MSWYFPGIGGYFINVGVMHLVKHVHAAAATTIKIYKH